MPEHRRHHLDGVRGLAIALVLLAHVTGVNGAGLVGVLLFFVLSGYLITSLLLAEHARVGRIDLRQFYVRRGLRLLPALLLLLAAYGLAITLYDFGTSLREGARGIVLAITYTTDIALGLGTGFVPELAHLWSLAVEEQFYLLWPFVLAALLARFPRARQIRWVVLMALTGSLLRCLSLAVAPMLSLYLYALPTTWVDALLIGALLALLRQTAAVSWLRPLSHPGVTGMALAVLIAFAAYPGIYESAFTYTLGIPLMSVAAAVLICSLEYGDTLRVPFWSALFSHRIARWLGKLSYGLYLYNSACILLVRHLAGSNLNARLAGLGAALVMAAVSFALVERPCLRAKSRVGAPRERKVGQPVAP